MADGFLDPSTWGDVQRSLVTSDGTLLYPLNPDTYSQPPFHDRAGSGDLSSITAVRKGDHVLFSEVETDLSMSSFGLTVQQANHTLVHEGLLRGLDPDLHNVAENYEGAGIVGLGYATPLMADELTQYHDDYEASMRIHMGVDGMGSDYGALASSSSLPPPCSASIAVNNPFVNVDEIANTGEVLDNGEQAVLSSQHQILEGFPLSLEDPFNDEGYKVQIGSRFDALNISLSAEEIQVKEEIRKHALFPNVVSAHIDCLAVGAGPADLQLLEEVKHKYQDQMQPEINIDSCVSREPNQAKLDPSMKFYLKALGEMKKNVQNPYLQQMAWCKEALDDVKHLGPTTTPAAAPAEQVSGRGGKGRSSRGTRNRKNPTRREQKRAARRAKYCTSLMLLDEKESLSVERATEETFVKDWLKLRHSPCDLLNLRGQCAIKRPQAKHSNNARDILTSWFNNRKSWPYPTEHEKKKLGRQTGLDTRQINNWFINQRKRHWDSAEKSAAMNRIAKDELNSLAQPTPDVVDMEGFAVVPMDDAAHRLEVLEDSLAQPTPEVVDMESLVSVPMEDVAKRLQEIVDSFAQPTPEVDIESLAVAPMDEVANRLEGIATQAVALSEALKGDVAVALDMMDPEELLKSTECLFC